MLFGLVCLGIGLWFATAAFVDLDFKNVNHMNGRSSQVVIEISTSLMLIGFGPRRLLRGKRGS
jgi:hypothetical protein